MLQINYLEILIHAFIISEILFIFKISTEPTNIFDFISTFFAKRLTEDSDELGIVVSSEDPAMLNNYYSDLALRNKRWKGFWCTYCFSVRISILYFGILYLGNLIGFQEAIFAICICSFLSSKK